MADVCRSYVHGVSPTPLLGEVIGANLERAVARWPDREAVLAAGLLALGLEPGQRVGIWAPNCIEWVTTQFATAKAGLILVNINPAYRLGELEYALNKVGCSALITADHFKTSDYIAMLRELLPELDGAEPGALESACIPSLRTVVRLGEVPQEAAARPNAHAWPNWRASSSSTMPSIFSSPAAPRGRRRRARSPTTTS
jgi:fatty-acyl-CoA synthase